jgi:4'-phosphopantetheinyl transferase
VKRLRRLNGTPRGVLADRELLDLVLPTLRADLTACDGYTYTDEPPLACPITVFGGSGDRAVRWKRLEAWRGQTTGAFRMRMFPGDHFFLQTAEAPLLAAVAQELSRPPGPATVGPGVWGPPPAGTFALPPGEVHLWRASLDQPDLSVIRLQRRLPAEERARAERFQFPRERRRYLVNRWLLRLILARYLACNPEEIRFRYTREGKPTLADEPGPDGLHFNTSRSHGLALYAIARGRELGVDLERPHNGFDYTRVARYLFSPGEFDTFRRLPAESHQQAFFACWTRKEACLKAAGQRLALDRFDVSLSPGERGALLATHADPQEARRWRLVDLDLGPHYVGALAAEGQDWRLCCWDWPADGSGLLPPAWRADHRRAGQARTPAPAGVALDGHRDVLTAAG